MPSSGNSGTAAADLSGLNVGDVVDFTGSVHYANANAASGPSCNPGKAKVTAKYPTGKHPVHLVAVSGGGSNVYGWVNIGDILVESSGTTSSSKKSVAEIAGEVIDGKWGNGSDRVNRLTAAGYDASAVQDAVNEKLGGSSAPKAPSWTPAVGDTVNYNGSVHYASANAGSGPACKGGKAKITAIFQLGKSKHPYHLVRVSGSGATVYGWVDAGSFSKA